MGVSKTALFLDRIVAAAQPVFDRVIAVDRHGSSPQVIETIFENVHQDEAPVFGVRRALEHAQSKCFILAVDYPLLTSELLRVWSTRFAASSATMLVPRAKGRDHVLCAGWSSSLLPAIDARIAKRQYDLQTIAVDAVVVDHDGVELMNVNDRLELEQYERQRLLASR